MTNQSPAPAAPAPRKANGWGVAAVIVAVLAIVGAVIPLLGWIFVWIFGGLAVIFAIIGIVRFFHARRGIVTAIIGLVLAIVAFVMLSNGGGVIW